MTRTVLSALGVVLLSASVSYAAPYEIRFGISTDSPNKPPTAGEWTFDGEFGSPLLGRDIEVDTVASVHTPANDGALFALTNGRLNLTSGAFVTTSGEGFRSLHFGPGGSLTITGSLELPDGTVVDGTDAATPLLQARFVNLVILELPQGRSPTTARLIGGVHSELEQHFGVQAGSEWAMDFDITFGVREGRPYEEMFFESLQTFDGELAATVPEPTTFLLLGAGAAAAGLRRRRRSDASDSRG